MPRSPNVGRRVQTADLIFAGFLIAYACVSLTLIPFDFTDLCYLFSLEQHRWVTQEWVHPIYVPALRAFAEALGLLGYHGHMLVPVEMLNVAASTAAFALLYSLARRFPGSALTAAATLAVAALSIGFWSATLRSTPYALALLCQTLSLRQLISELPAPPRRYALAGVFAGLAMGLHASAMALGPVAIVCALFEPDPARTPQATLRRVASFGAAMLAVVLAAWTVFLVYNGIGPEYFQRQDFHSTWIGIEQVPGRSIYTNDSLATQFGDFADVMRYQVGLVLLLAIALLPFAFIRRRWAGASLTAFERRLTTAAAANFAAIAGFFALNGSHNGFIFASVTLVPVLIAVALRGSWLGLAAVLLLGGPGTRQNIGAITQAGAQGANDPQLAEVNYLERILGPHDVLLTPGSPFPEMLYLSHVNIFEISPGEPTHPGNEVPVLHPGVALRGRIAWWLDHGVRVFYALGDTVTDFTGDLGGAEKEHQIFWRPEIAAHERVQALEAIRTGLESSGLVVREALVSPRGERYGEVRLAEATAPLQPPTASPALAASELSLSSSLGPWGNDDPMLPRRAQFLGELAAAVPGDPWLACDVMDLICQGQPQRNGAPIPCHPIPGCDESVGRPVMALARTEPNDERRQHVRQPPAPHLGPAVGSLLQAAADHALQPVVQNGLTVTRVDIHDDAIEVGVHDAHDAAYAVTLALPSAKHGARPDGRGRNFVFYLSPSSGISRDAATALLASAALFDEAIPESALNSAVPRE
jgi:hypothetical protein